jgi:hypothetical protein
MGNKKIERDSFVGCISEDINEKIKYYSEASVEELEDIANDGGLVEDVPSVLSELYRRDPVKALRMAEAIITEKKGDKHLRSWVVNFLDMRR